MNNNEEKVSHCISLLSYNIMFALFEFSEIVITCKLENKKRYLVGLC